MRTFIAILLACISTGVFAQQAEGTDFKKLFMKALNSPTGKASSDVTGPIADSIRGQINSPNARIVAEVETIQSLPQEGCKRMQLRLTSPGLMLATVTGSKAPLRLGVLLNLCTDGEPPIPETNGRKGDIFMKKLAGNPAIVANAVRQG